MSDLILGKGYPIFAHNHVMVALLNKYPHDKKKAYLFMELNRKKLNKNFTYELVLRKMENSSE